MAWDFLKLPCVFFPSPTPVQINKENVKYLQLSQIFLLNFICDKILYDCYNFAYGFFRSRAILLLTVFFLYYYFNL